MKIKYYIKKAFQNFNKVELRILPGNIAFFFVLALIPIVSMLVMLASYFSVSMDMIANFINDLLPSEASDLVINIMFEKGLDSSIGLFNLIAIFVASNGTYAIITASNTLYKVNNSDHLKDRIRSLILLLILLLLLLFLIIGPMFGGKLLSLFDNNDLVNNIRTIFNIVKWPTTIFLIYVNLKMIYTIAPSIKINSKSTTTGAWFTTIIWTILTAIFSYYLKYFANYSAIYGSLSNLIILMIWLYAISYVFVLGLAINVTNIDEK